MYAFHRTDRIVPCHPLVKAWLWRRWPVLLLGSLCGFYVLRYAMRGEEPHAAGDAKLAGGVSRVKG